MPTTLTSTPLSSSAQNPAGASVASLTATPMTSSGQNPTEMFTSVAGFYPGDYPGLYPGAGTILDATAIANNTLTGTGM